MVRLATHREAGRVRIEVSDTGCGIPADSLPKIFDPFFSTKPGGTGLGLSVSAQILEDHGGCLLVKSEPGKGTTITAVLSEPPSKRDASGAA